MEGSGRDDKRAWDVNRSGRMVSLNFFWKGVFLRVAGLNLREQTNFGRGSLQKLQTCENIHLEFVHIDYVDQHH